MCEYRRVLSGKKTLLVCSTDYGGLVEEGSFSKKLVVDRKRMFSDFPYFFSLLRTLKSIQSQKVIHPSWSRLHYGDVLVHMIPAKEKIGMIGWRDTRSCRLHRKDYTRLVEDPLDHFEISAIDKFTREVINDQYRYGNNKLSMPFVDYGLEKPYVVISISSAVESKIWEMKRFAAVIDQIPDAFDVVLCGVGDKDCKRAKTIQSCVKGSLARIHSLVGQTTLAGYLSLIERAAYVIGNDSSAIHIAAATHTPSICIVIAPNTFVPYPDLLVDAAYAPRAVYYRGTTPDCEGCTKGGSCLNCVTEEMVCSEMNKILKGLGYDC